MNCKLFASVQLCAALLSGCNSAPTLTLPSGQWVEINQPSATPPINVTTATSYKAALTPGVPVSVPVPPVKAFVPLPVVAPGPAVTIDSPPKAIANPIMAAGKPAGKAVPAVAIPAKVIPAAVIPPTVKAPSVPPLRVELKPKVIWTANSGTTLRETIQRWATKERYTLDWQAPDLDYPIVAPLEFEGSFESAVAAIFTLYDKSKRPFLVEGKRKQKRLIVKENLPTTGRASL